MKDYATLMKEIELLLIDGVAPRHSPVAPTKTDSSPDSNSMGMEQVAERDKAEHADMVLGTQATPASVFMEEGLGSTIDGIPRRELPWGKKVSTEFLDKVLWIESDLGLKAENLMNCMAFESGETFSPSVKNPGSSATGLIQFMSFTAKRLGTTTASLALMTAESQLNYVYKYFKGYGGDLSGWDLGDCYMAILWPAGIGKPADYPVFVASKGNTYAVNRGLDADKNGVVTRAECIAKILEKSKRGELYFGYGDLD